MAWTVVEAAGKTRSIEIFLNFMIMDANMNAVRRDPDSADPRQVERMNRFWGDTSWRKAGYHQHNLFGTDEKGSNDDLAQAYRERLKTVAGFKYVPDPVPMKTRTGSTIYYLYFASPNATGNKIVSHIFDKYRKLGRS